MWECDIRLGGGFTLLETDSGSGVSGVAAFPGQSATRALPPVFPRALDQTINPPSGHTTHAPPGYTINPPSPPRSNAGQKRIWKCGAEVIRDPQEAEDLARQGWLLREVDEKRHHTSRRERDKTNRVRKWLCEIEARVIADPQEAEDLSQQGWSLREVDVNEDGRDQPPKRKRCATTSTAWNGPAKKHRIE